VPVARQEQQISRPEVIVPRQEPQSLQLTAQLAALRAATSRLEEFSQGNTLALQELSGELASLRGELTSLRGQLRDLPVAPPSMPEPLFPPEPAGSRPSRFGTVASLLAAIAGLGALGGTAIMFRMQRQQLSRLNQTAVSTETLSKAVGELGEQASARAAAEAAAKTPPACPAPAEPPPPPKPKVLLPNLVGLRLREARAAVAPLQLQLLPTDKKLKEVAKIGWQSPNAGTEMESSEDSVSVALKPPPDASKDKQKKKKHE
jgi:hypothetical protein